MADFTVGKVTVEGDRDTYILELTGAGDLAVEDGTKVYHAEDAQEVIDVLRWANKHLLPFFLEKEAKKHDAK